jgi:hypothetical protein
MDPITIALAFINGWKIGGFIGELFSTRHARDIELASEQVDSFEQNHNPVLLKKAIEYLERVDESDKKYAQCYAFNGIAYCYYTLSALSLENKKFDEALAYLSMGENYPGKILQVEVTLLTRKGSEIDKLQSEVPETIDRFRNLKQEILVKKQEEERRRKLSSPSSEISWKTVAVCVAATTVIAVIALLVAYFIF